MQGALTAVFLQIRGLGSLELIAFGRAIVLARRICDSVMLLFVLWSLMDSFQPEIDVEYIVQTVFILKLNCLLILYLSVRKLEHYCVFVCK